MKHPSFVLAACLFAAVNPPRAFLTASLLPPALVAEGAILTHLLAAVSPQRAGASAALSRDLVALWADEYSPALGLLKRVFPPGLMRYLNQRRPPAQQAQQASLAPGKPAPEGPPAQAGPEAAAAAAPPAVQQQQPAHGLAAAGAAAGAAAPGVPGAAAAPTPAARADPLQPAQQQLQQQGELPPQPSSPLKQSLLSAAPQPQGAGGLARGGSARCGARPPAHMVFMPVAAKPRHPLQAPTMCMRHILPPHPLQLPSRATGPPSGRRWGGTTATWRWSGTRPPGGS